MLGDLDNIMSHADKFKKIHFSGLNYDYYSSYISTVKSISAEKIQQMAQQYLNSSDFVQVIVGKLKKD